MGVKFIRYLQVGDKVRVTRDLEDELMRTIAPAYIGTKGSIGRVATLDEYMIQASRTFAINKGEIETRKYMETAMEACFAYPIKYEEVIRPLELDDPSSPYYRHSMRFRRGDIKSISILDLEKLNLIGDQAFFTLDKVSFVDRHGVISARAGHKILFVRLSLGKTDQSVLDFLLPPLCWLLKPSVQICTHLT